MEFIAQDIVEDRGMNEFKMDEICGEEVHWWVLSTGAGCNTSWGVPEQLPVCPSSLAMAGDRTWLSAGPSVVVLSPQPGVFGALHCQGMAQQHWEVPGG